MKILVITPIYPAAYNPIGTTPLMHYFTKKWVEQGHKVCVLDFCSKYPQPMVWVARLFKKILVSKLGIVVPLMQPWDYDEIQDGVEIHHYGLNKVIPHGRFGKKSITKAIAIAEGFIKEDKPNMIIGHWANPSLDIISQLRAKYEIPCSVVFHETAEDIIHYYGLESQSMIKKIDVLGFRSKPLKENFEAVFGKHKSFMAYSGVPENFLKEAKLVPEKTFETIGNFIFVGSLMERKHPAEILPALKNVYSDNKKYKMVYVGEGKESEKINTFCKQNNAETNVLLTGRIPRDEIMEYLKKSEVFIMISEAEVFGLVYLEAMAFGCITIASKGEGFDGIIEDGVNGFLCEAGNSEELAFIITKIKSLPKEEICHISNRAKQTAQKFSDSLVAENYLNNIINLTK